MSESTLEPLLWGFIGGLLGQLLKLIHHANLPKEDRPALMSDPMFWFAWLLLGALGAIVTVAYERSGVKLPPIVAINVGASAPLIAEKLLSSVPAVGKTG
jgi:hypothetical protein